MKKTVCFFVVILSCIKLTAQTPNFQWAKGMGSSGDDKGNSIAVDASGNVYTTGSFSATSDFDPGPGTYTLNPGTVTDVFISKLDANGNFVWTKSLGGTNAGGEGYGIKVDVSGNVVVTGVIYGVVDLDPGSGVYTSSIGGSNNVFILKLDASGNFLWAGSMCPDGIGYALDTDVSGNVYATGCFKGVGDFDPSAASYILNASTSVYAQFILKWTSSGTFVWAKAIGGFAGQIGNSIALDGNANVYTTGWYQGSADFDPGSGTFALTAISVQDAFILKLDASGNFVWANSYGGVNNDWGYSVETDGLGNIYFSGEFKQTTDFDPSAAVFNITPDFGHDIILAKYDPSGNLLWAKDLGYLVYNYQNPLAVDASNNVYTTGRYSGTQDFDPGVGTFSMTSSPSSYAIYILKLDASGNFVWAQSSGGGGSGDDRGGRGIAVDVSNNVYTTGLYGVTVDFDMGSGTYTLSSTVGVYTNDIYVLKMGQTTCVAPSSPTSTTTFSNQSICTNNATTLTATSAGTINWYATSTGTTVLGTGNSFVTPMLSTGTYTYYAEAFTCTVSATRTAIDVMVNANPTITISATSSTICSGSPSTLTANGAMFYNWSTGPLTQSISVSPTVTTSYSVSGADMNGCSSVSTISINVNALPMVTASTTSSLICTGETATLTANGTVNTYTWSTTDNASSIVVTPTITTTYTVDGMDVNGCSNSATITQSVSLCTSLTEAVNHGIMIYPNPASEILFVDNQLNQELSVKLFDVNGKLIYNEISSIDKLTIDVKSFAKGMYLLSVNTNSNDRIIKKVIKE